MFRGGPAAEAMLGARLVHEAIGAVRALAGDTGSAEDEDESRV